MRCWGTELDPSTQGKAERICGSTQCGCLLTWRRAYPQEKPARAGLPSHPPSTPPNKANLHQVSYFHWEYESPSFARSALWAPSCCHRCALFQWHLFPPLQWSCSLPGACSTPTADLVRCKALREEGATKAKSIHLLPAPWRTCCCLSTCHWVSRIAVF